jgi:mannose-6-phosphate isomerase-like protein (cupin superfamily)
LLFEFSNLVHGRCILCAFTTAYSETTHNITASRERRLNEGFKMSEASTRKKLVEAAPHASFNLDEIVKTFPETAETLLVDTRLTDEDEASARVFRVYHPTPAHYHATCDEYLIVLSGRATFFMGDRDEFEVGPGEMLFFKKFTVHGMPKILEHPLFMVSVDTPRRDPSDIIFVDPSSGTAESFVQAKP